MKNRTILIACISLDYILIEKILETDFRLETVHSPEEILKQKELARYDLLLIDVLFLRAVPEILEQAQKHQLPVIALSSEPGDARDQGLLKGGCCACYIKPIRHELFFPFISDWMEQTSVPGRS